MIGLVIVSHSPRLAEAAVELALEMVHGEAPPMRIAAGVDGRFGTDAAAVATAIDEVAGEPGVLVITDLGSAVLSAGLALELRESSTEVLVSAGPFVEGITAGVVLAATGAPLGEVAREVAGALDAKRDQLEPRRRGAAAGLRRTRSRWTRSSSIPKDCTPGLRRCSCRPSAATTPSST